MALKVDVHAHLYPEPYIAELDRLLVNPQTPEERLTWATLQGKIKKNPAMWTLDERLELMDKLEVDYQALSVSIPQCYEGDAATRQRLATWCNDLYADVIAKRPKQFLAFASLPLPDIDASLKELERCIDQLHFAGVCLGSNVKGKRYDDPHFAPLFDEIDRRGLVVFFHPMTAACAAGQEDFNAVASLGYIFDTGLTVYRMLFSGMFDRYPNFKLIVPHLGGMLPYHIGRIEGAYKSNPACQNIAHPPTEYLKELYYDVVSFYEPALHLAAQAFGTDHLLLGSDYPFGMGDIEMAVRSVQAAFPQADQDKIFGENAQRLFPELASR
ncbi:MAG TPA: amidohydrolase family protein [Chloroflexota bacterium]|nr:amidohydrolase family protein [Chloroflexota bacterium]